MVRGNLPERIFNPIKGNKLKRKKKLDKTKIKTEVEMNNNKIKL